jgi:2-oxoisovalerate dehydrogenase E1 component
MTKALFVSPEETRKKGTIEFDPIPLNTYDRPIKDAAAELGAEDVVRLHRDMCILREFESSIDSIKKTGAYKGIEYNHRGPAHLSIGQEALAVGQAYTLGQDDAMLGSHRSHSEILARGLRAIQLFDDESLTRIMSGYMDGATLKCVEGDADGDTKSLAADFFVYGTMAEIFARETGWNKGLGGSMHAFFIPFGIYPNNAIVGGSGDISVGVALFKKVNRKPGIVVCNIGDASIGCGPVWEGLCFAAMDQFRELWDEEHRGGLPLIFNFVNNHYGMGGQPVGETMGFKVLARLGAGINPDQMHSERIDGMNPLAVIDAFQRKRKVLESGEGPALLDSVTYRLCGHSPSDASSYREAEELAAWEAEDSLRVFADELVAAGLADDGKVASHHELAEALVLKAFKKAIDPKVSPYLDPSTTPCVEQVMFSNNEKPAMGEGEPDVLMPMAENPQVKRLAKKSRVGVDDKGKKLSGMKAIVIKDALFEAIIDRFYEDPTLCAWGEENRDWGGPFAVYRGLTESLPYHRLFNSPISEGAIVGAAVGYAMSGGRALVELMYCDFLGRSGDEVFNQLSKWQAMSAGALEMPVVLRVSVGSKYGAQHSQDWSSLCTHIPGLKAVFPATPYDAKGLMYSALTGTDPVLFFESQRLYDMPEIFEKEGVPAEAYTVPIGEPAVRKVGSDLTICTLGATLYRALDAAAELEAKHGLSCEVIDLRSLNPLNYEPIVQSIRKTGYCLLSSDACERGSFMHTVASNLQAMAFDHLDAPICVVGAKNWITPPAEQEESFFPQVEWLVDAVHERLRPLAGYSPTTRWTDGEIIRVNRLGV